VPPDFTLDLHGATLEAAHARLEHGLALALAQQARLVLLITGRPRPGGERTGRGVIRRKFMDWLAAGPHAGRIAAIRPAHPRHGGAGAVYIVLRRPR
jgi:DNA-nicking Smr family endonuclease